MWTDGRTDMAKLTGALRDFTRRRLMTNTWLPYRHSKTDHGSRMTCSMAIRHDSPKRVVDRHIDCSDHGKDTNHTHNRHNRTVIVSKPTKCRQVQNGRRVAYGLIPRSLDLKQSRKSGALTYRNPLGHLGLSRDTFTFLP